tara:strand:- start:447 stop:674 length:228 start_codon:yes stop_codon:yes gene_type:complete
MEAPESRKYDASEISSAREITSSGMSSAIEAEGMESVFSSTSSSMTESCVADLFLATCPEATMDSGMDSSKPPDS